MDAMLCVFGFPSDSLSKKQIQDIFHEVYDNDDLRLEFHSIFDYDGYVVFDLIKSYELDGISYNELSNIQKKYFPITEENKKIYKDFFQKINRPELFDELDIFIYVARESATKDFYHNLLEIGK